MISQIYRPASLSGKNVLITGASAGIGKACAILFAEQGANVIIVSRREAKLEEVRSEILSIIPSASVRIEPCDVSNTACVKDLASRLSDVDIDILVNNAGLALGTESGDRISITDTVDMFNTNTIGLIALVNAFAPGMRARKSGDIVNISSVAGTDHYAGGAVYCATKSAVDAFSNALRMDLVDTNIRVITSALGSSVVLSSH